MAAFIRSIIGVEREIAFEKYRNLIHGAELTRQQEEYLRMLIRYVCENGDIATTVLQNPPFNTFTTIFRNTPTSLVREVHWASDCGITAQPPQKNSAPHLRNAKEAHRLLLPKTFFKRFLNGVQRAFKGRSETLTNAR